MGMKVHVGRGERERAGESSMGGWQEEPREKGLLGPGWEDRVLPSNRGHGGPLRMSCDSPSRVLSTTLPGVAH